LQTLESHPAPEVIERFVLAKADPAENQVVTRHLLGGCPRCQKIARAQLSRIAPLPQRRSMLSQPL
jgi:hypothetical protein